MSAKKYSICGLECSDCPCFIAYKNDDDRLREKFAKKWSQEFGWKDLKPEDMNCRGCQSTEGPVFKHCEICNVRKCGIEKDIDNCGMCSEYSNCAKIEKLHEEIPDGKPVCEKFREG